MSEEYTPSTEAQLQALRLQQHAASFGAPGAGLTAANLGITRMLQVPGELESSKEIPETSHVPDHPIDEITQSLRAREALRRQAIDVAFKQLETAGNDEKGQKAALNNIARMMNVLDEFHRQFPETFSPEESDE